MWGRINAPNTQPTITMKKPQPKPTDQVTPYEKLYTHKFYEENGVELEYSRPIAKSSMDRRPDLPEEGRENRRSARVGGEGTLPKGIHYYRMWFRYLKLALECEDKNIEVVVKPHYTTKRSDLYKGIGGAGSNVFIPKETTFLKVDREFYKDWDCDDVLTMTFDRWWKTHKELFHASNPEVVSKTSVKNDEDFIFLKLDRRMSSKDLLSFLNADVAPLLNQSPKYEVKGKGRYHHFLNRYNAVVCCMKGMSAVEIFSDRSGYIRAPEEKGDRVDKGGSIMVPHDKKTGQPKYSGVFQRQYQGGIDHLLEVCEGRFGAGTKVHV